MRKRGGSGIAMGVAVLTLGLLPARPLAASSLLDWTNNEGGTGLPLVESATVVPAKSLMLGLANHYLRDDTNDEVIASLVGTYGLIDRYLELGLVVPINVSPHETFLDPVRLLVKSNVLRWGDLDFALLGELASPGAHTPEFGYQVGLAGQWTLGHLLLLGNLRYGSREALTSGRVEHLTGIWAAGGLGYVLGEHLLLSVELGAANLDVGSGLLSGADQDLFAQLGLRYVFAKRWHVSVSAGGGLVGTERSNTDLTGGFVLAYRFGGMEVAERPTPKRPTPTAAPLPTTTLPPTGPPPLLDQIATLLERVGWKAKLLENERVAVIRFRGKHGRVNFYMQALPSGKGVLLFVAPPKPVAAERKAELSKLLREMNRKARGGLFIVAPNDQLRFQTMVRARDGKLELTPKALKKLVLRLVRTLDRALPELAPYLAE